MSLRILIVDDDDVFLRVMSRSLERYQLATESALDGLSAIDKCTTFLPDAILLDLKLGQDNGLDLIQQLLSIKPDVKIVLLTGYASIATAVEAIKRGAFDYLPKPVATTDVLKTLGINKAASNTSYQKVTNKEQEDIEGPSLQRLEWEHIQRVLADHDGNISATARALGMHRRTLQRKLAIRPVQK